MRGYTAVLTCDVRPCNRVHSDFPAPKPVDVPVRNQLLNGTTTVSPESPIIWFVEIPARPLDTARTD
ncbi:hypothetical protein BH23CHL4_BH23CHL4_09180 [soil metagenome]